jgi:hypothetical protein
MRTKRSASVSLETTLNDAKVPSAPEMRTYRSEVDEQQLVSSLIQNVKKEHKGTSPFMSWMGQLFPDEYKEMVSADVR